jgi:hypothetical protein
VVAILGWGIASTELLNAAVSEDRIPLYLGDFQTNCEALKSSKADYALLANTGGSNNPLLRSCADMEVKTQRMAHTSGFNEHVMKYAGTAADGVVWSRRVALWSDDVPGMETVRAISAISDPDSLYRPLQLSLSHESNATVEKL